MRYFLYVFIITQLLSITSNARLSDNEINTLLLTYKEKLDGLPTGKDKFNFAFSKYPQENLYKIFIDKARLLNPKSGDEERSPPHLLFDVDEPGYYSSMTNAFRVLPNFVDEPLTLELIITLHDIAVNSVYPKNGKIFKKGISIGGGYGIPRAKFNLSALKELFYSQILYDQTLFFMAVPEKNSHVLAPPTILKALRDSYGPIGGTLLANEEHEHFLAWTNDFNGCIKGIDDNEDGLKKKLEPLFRHYEESIKTTSTLMGRLGAIGELLRALEVSHFFNDGNQRTYAFLLLTKLLIENGLPPALLDDPTMFDGFMTVSGMALAIKNGIINFLNEDHEQQMTLVDELNLPRLDSRWLDAENEYQPYFAKGPSFLRVHKMITDKRSTLKEKINTIPLENINIIHDNIHPLSLAILLDDMDLMDHLLDNGASPFGNKNEKWLFYQNTPFAFSMALHGLEFAGILLKKTAQEQLMDAPVVSLVDAINAVIAKNDEDNFSDTILRILLPIVVARKNEIENLDNLAMRLKEWALGGEQQSILHRLEILTELGFAIE